MGPKTSSLVHRFINMVAYLLQPCSGLKQAVNRPFLKEAVSQIRNRTYEILHLVKLALPVLCHRSPRQG